MRVIVVGTGTVGSAVGKTLKEHGHEVVSMGRNSGDYQADISDIASLEKRFANLGPFDAVANAAGDVFLGRLKTSPVSNGRSLSPGKAWAKSTSSVPRFRTLRTRA
jgi:nucleoside-diphosphate-sugar epimerase